MLIHRHKFEHYHGLAQYNKSIKVPVRSIFRGKRSPADKRYSSIAGQMDG